MSAPTSALLARAQADAFADAVGEDRAKVAVVDQQWRNLLDAVCIVKIHVTRWRAETTLTLSDLGIAPKDLSERKAIEGFLNLGGRYLLPKRVIERGQQLENKFRNALYRASIPSPWGNLVPQKRYSAWRAEVAQIKAEYEAWAEDVYICWPELMLEVEAGYRELGLQAWNRLDQAGFNVPAMSEFVAEFVKRSMAKCETRERFLSKAAMWWDDPKFLPLTETSDEALQAAYDAAKNEMERDIYAGAKAQFETGLFDFMASVRGELTERIFNVLVDVLTACDANGGDLPRNSSKQLKNLLQAVEELKFWQDDKLDAQMAKISGLLDVKAARRNEDELKDVMRQVGAEARILLNELGRPVDRKSRQVGIADAEKSEGTIMRTARKSIAVDEEDAAPVRARTGRKLEVDLS